MLSSGRKKGTVRFSLDAGQTARRVFLAGDFTDWEPKRMRRQKNDMFVLTLPVPPGTHQYRFIVDDQWVTDPDNSDYAPNPYGSFNSVATVV
jgi:1,4-alpha-glucan branching enzyme